MVKFNAVFQVLIALLFTSTLQAEERLTYLVQKKHLKYAVSFAADDALLKGLKNVNEEFVRVKLTPTQLDRLAAGIHNVNHQCGGFAEVDPNLSTKELAQQIIAAKQTETQNNEFATLEPQFPTQVNAFMESLDIDQYMTFIDQLAQFNDRSARSNLGVQASEWIKDKVEGWKQEFSREDLSVQFIDTPRYRQKSIMVKIEGEQTELPAVVVGGHMDTLSTNKPGADDDASGSSTLFEVVHKILKNNIQFERTTYFIFYAAEEVGLVGSRAVVQHFIDNNIAVRAVMQLDMTGYAERQSENKVFFVRDYTNNNLTIYTKKLAKAYLGKSEEQIEDLRCRYACSDHARWTNKGFPAVFPFESKFGDHSPNIHTSRDTKQTISPEHAHQFLKLAGAFVVELAEPIN